ncbi:serine/threonine-protein kinase [Protaetiibacter intestinalis]|nr:serine/threonine-protein kinase [Protaetiibacter intestinalis]
MNRRSAATPPVLPGFSYVRPLGSGGFADVFLYEQEMPRRVVAVKVLLADALNPEVLSSFAAEADVMARLSAHPSILTIYQASISADGRPYLATEFCPDSYGVRYKQAPASLAETLDVGVRMASALETAHRAGVLHRDVKPTNVLIASLGTPVLADFGIAASLSAADDGDESFAMSVPWSAPEVVSGSTSGTVASEVWSLGATLYTLLAGRSPFASDDKTKNTRDAMISRIIRAHYTELGRADVPPAVEELLRSTMAKDPSKRPESMAALAEKLRWLQYELGQVPSPIEIAGGLGAGVSAASAGAPRGPVITTVNPDSRRAARAAAASGRDPDAATRRASARRPIGLVVGLAVGAVVLVGAVVAVLLAVGVI